MRLYRYLGASKQARCWRFTFTSTAMLVWLASWTLGFAYMPELELPGRTTYSGSVSAATLPLNGDFSGAGVCEISHNQKCNHMTSSTRAIAGSGQIWRYLAKCAKCHCTGKTGKFNAARCGERLEKHVGEACDGEAAGDWAGKQWLCKEGLKCTAGKCASAAELKTAGRSAAEGVQVRKYPAVLCPTSRTRAQETPPQRCGFAGNLLLPLTQLLTPRRPRHRSLHTKRRVRRSWLHYFAPARCRQPTCPTPTRGPRTSVPMPS